MLDVDFLLEAAEMPPVQKKRAVVVVGRFQPPHCGHNFIISEAKNEFTDGKYDAVIVVVVVGEKSSEDKKINPLTAEERLHYLSHLTSSKGVKFLTAKNAVDAFVKVREAGYEPIVIVGGKLEKEDRALSYKENILDKYFKNRDGSAIEHKAISVERDAKADDVKAVSGSIIRAAVAADRPEDFADWSCMDSDKLTNTMYKTLRDNMGFGDKDE